MNGFMTILYTLGLFFAFAAGSMLLQRQAAFLQSTTAKPTFPRATVLLLLAIAIPSILQFFFPTILLTFQRDYERFRMGDWWRLISPLFVQDGGVIGTIFNLVSLALVGSLAERIWNGRSMLIIFFVGGVIGEIAGFAWQPVGAGNSVGNFSLAASIAVVSLMRLPFTPVILFAVIALGADGVLLWLQDIHGAAALVGTIQALFLIRVWHDKGLG
ncbi:MAG TPA: rhomboid family intramembrane serine protease [Anaerolineales bacterium]|nr:rhomboid family intramembrane serine protease [Anaerolineales bacterium]